MNNRAVQSLVAAFGFIVMTHVGVSSVSAQAVAAPTTRLENEVMLALGGHDPEEIWRFLKKHFEHGATLQGKEFTTVESVEQFRDVYYDTPGRRLAHQWSGLRHRKRVGEAGELKELIQLKTTPRFHVDARDQNRLEHKFGVRNARVEPPSNSASNEITLLVKKGERQRFLHAVQALGVSPERLERFLTVEQERRRIYFRQGEKQFFTVTLDLTESRYLWYTVRFPQLELEIGENAFTTASDAERQQLLALQSEVLATLKAQFPALAPDQTPKIVKVYEDILARGAIARLLIDRLSFVLCGLGLVLLIVVGVVSRFRRRR